MVFKRLASFILACRCDHPGTDSGPERRGTFHLYHSHGQTWPQALGLSVEMEGAVCAMLL